MEKIELDLTSADRCDRCSAQALYRMSLLSVSGVLDLCGHHWRANSAAMFGAGWVITGSAPGGVGTAVPV